MYQFIVGNQPNLMFIHFDSIDDAGHTYQWGTKEYYDAVKVCLLSTHLRMLTVYELCLQISQGEQDFYNTLAAHAKLWKKVHVAGLA